ncbi:MAG: sugar phosphate isomerase/epimerase [Clostridia bacterium]|nr:sugar phosphate isomerase/epimerase [Clostridia bacterium]
MEKMIGISIGQLQQKYGDARALEIAREIGADAVDFGLDQPANDYRREDSLYAKGDEAVTAYYRELGARARALGLIVSQTHGKLSGFKSVAEENDALVENSRLDILATAALGAPVCVIHTATTGGNGSDATSAQMHRLNYEQFTRILPYAAEHGVKIATETFGDSPRHGCCDFFGNADEFIKGYQAVKASEWGQYFTTCIDTGHSNKAMRFGNPTPADVIRRVGSDIAVLHLNDNDTLTDQHKPPLSGTIDWEDVLTALDEVGYGGVYNMELNLRCFGKELMIDTAAFSVKVMRNLLRTHERV